MKKDKKNKIFKDKVFIILLIMLVLVTIWLLLTIVSNRNNLKLNDKTLNEIHNYFNFDDLDKCEGLFNYTDKKVNSKNIEDEIKNCIAYNKSDIKNIEEETLKTESKKNICKKDDMIFRAEDDTTECKITKIKKKYIDNTYKKIFGEGIGNIESFKVDNFNICYLSNDYYYCGLSETFTYTIGSESSIYRVLNRAVEKGNQIVIYDYFIRINNDKCYSNYTTSNINSECNDKYSKLKKKKIDYKFMKKYGTEYKHIYEKAKDGTYYWVSSEPVTKK